MKKPQTLSEAIARLEEKGKDSVEDFKEILTRDYGHILKTLENFKVKEEATEFKNRVQEEAAEFKNKVQEEATEFKNRAQQQATELKDKVSEEVKTQVEDHPLVTLGLVGLLFFFVGWIFGSRKK